MKKEKQINSEELNYPLQEFNKLTESNQTTVEEFKSMIKRTYLEAETPLSTDNEDESSYALEWEAE